jgi:Domain of unknown function (DUF4147)
MPRGILVDEPRQFLLRALKAAIDASLPAQRVKAFLPEPRAGRTIVIGAGKAAASMAAAVEEHWVGPLSGLFTDDAPKLELAEKAIASLRKRMTSVEEESARMSGVANQSAATTHQLTSLEEAFRKSAKNLTIRSATTAVLLRKETARANELAGKVAALEAALEQVTDALLQRKVI